MAKPILGKNGYLDYNAIFEDDVDMYMILGQRSDGKTYGVLERAVKEYFVNGLPSAYVRRFDESIKKRAVQFLCRPQGKNIRKFSKGEYNASKYYSNAFYATSLEDEKKSDKEPFLINYALNTWETSKGQDVGAFNYVIFDEFVSAGKYLPGEYAIFENVLSSILRNRGNSKLVMLGNPISQVCPYFDEFNLEPHKLSPGDIVYRISSNGHKLKFVYVPPMDKKHRMSSKFFDFGNSDSIKTGYWEFGEFPHVPNGLIKSSDMLARFIILFRKQIAMCEFYYYNGVIFAFWRPCNEKYLQDDEITMFSDTHFFQRNVFTAWSNSRICELYMKCVKSNRQYFSDNKVGNLVKNWYQEFVLRGGRFV